MPPPTLPSSSRALKAQPRNTMPRKRLRGTESNKLNDRPPAIRLIQHKPQPPRSKRQPRRRTAADSFLKFAQKAIYRFPSFPTLRKGLLTNDVAKRTPRRK